MGTSTRADCCYLELGGAGVGRISLFSMCFLCITSGAARYYTASGGVVKDIQTQIKLLCLSLTLHARLHWVTRTWHIRLVNHQGESDPRGVSNEKRPRVAIRGGVLYVDTIIRADGIAPGISSQRTR